MLDLKLVGHEVNSHAVILSKSFKNVNLPARGIIWNWLIAVMLCGWEGNCRSHTALAMHRWIGISTYRLKSAPVEGRYVLHLKYTRHITLAFVSCSSSFRISAPKIWNLLPASIRNSPPLSAFRRHLKTHYFQSAYPNPLTTIPSQCALIL